LSGVVLTIWIVALSCIFAKDQIVNLLNSNNENPELSANVVNITENNNEEITNEEVTNEENSLETEDIENIDFEEDLSDINEYDENDVSEENYWDFSDYEDEESLNNEINDYESEDITNKDSENIDENLSEDNIVNEEDTNEDLGNINSEEIYEDFNNEEISKNDNWYYISYVNSEDEANWVLPAHCSDLTCYGENKEFTPCSSFKKIDNLDENANRIGNNWVCRYKDASELVYVELK
jgi:hypothetical protein